MVLPPFCRRVTPKAGSTKPCSGPRSRDVWSSSNICSRQAQMYMKMLSLHSLGLRLTCGEGDIATNRPMRWSSRCPHWVYFAPVCGSYDQTAARQFNGLADLGEALALALK
jgi:hypothetical protein